MEVPATTNDVVLLPVILVFFGALVYGIAFANGVRDHVFPKYRWVGVLLLVAATVVGAKFTSYMVDSNAAFYKSMIGSRKVQFAHYVALAIPVAALAVVAAMEMWFRRYQRSME